MGISMPSKSIFFKYITKIKFKLFSKIFLNASTIARLHIKEHDCDIYLCYMKLFWPALLY